MCAVCLEVCRPALSPYSLLIPEPAALAKVFFKLKDKVMCHGY